MRWFPGWLLLAASGCTWDAPPLEGPGLLNSIAGTVVYVGDDEIAPTFVTVFDARNPGPPVGTGSPVSFTAISPGAWSDTLDLPAAPFGVSQLRDGDYFVNALMDIDGDFNPLQGTLAGATCGDWLGSHVSDLETLTPQAVGFPTRNDRDAEGVRLEDVTVLVGQRLTVERPVFTFVGPTDISLSELSTSPIPPTFTITVDEVDAEYANVDPRSQNVTVPIQLGPACEPDPALDEVPLELVATRTCALTPSFEPTTGPCSTAILTEIPDVDGNGLPDPSIDPALADAGLPEIWPRVFLEYVPGPDDEPLDTYPNEDGVLLTERWITQAIPYLVQLEAIQQAIAAQQPPPPFVLPPAGQPVLAHSISVTVLPVFLHFWEGGQIDNNDGRGPYDIVDASVAPPNTIPLGAWGATVITRAGQTWTVPNTLAGGLFPVTSELDLTPQGASLALVP